MFSVTSAVFLLFVITFGDFVTGKPNCADENLDWVMFCEGGLQTVGKCPTPESGVTVGIGIDLGQQDEATLSKFNIPKSIIDKVRPFLRLETKQAVYDKGLRPENLRLTTAEAETITKPFMKEDQEQAWKYSGKLSCKGVDVLVSLVHWAGSLNSKQSWKLCVKDPKKSSNCVNYVWMAIGANTATDAMLKEALQNTLQFTKNRTAAYNRIAREITHL